jgi:hypothetical protein
MDCGRRLRSRLIQSQVSAGSNSAFEFWRKIYENAGRGRFKRSESGVLPGSAVGANAL